MGGVRQNEEICFRDFLQIESQEMNLIGGFDEIMIQRLDDHTGLAAPRELTEFDRRFGIHGDSQGPFVLRRDLMNFRQFIKDGVCFWYFFWAGSF